MSSCVCVQQSGEQYSFPQRSFAVLTMDYGIGQGDGAGDTCIVMCVPSENKLKQLYNEKKKFSTKLFVLWAVCKCGLAGSV